MLYENPFVAKNHSTYLNNEAQPLFLMVLLCTAMSTVNSAGRVLFYRQSSDADGVLLTLMHQIKVHPFPGVPEKHIGAAAQLDPWLAEFVCIAFSESIRGLFLTRQCC